MDPTENLREQRLLFRKFRAKNRLTASEASRLVELSDSLDEWISKGGFLPEQWRAKPAATG